MSAFKRSYLIQFPGSQEEKNSIFQTHTETKFFPTNSWVLNAVCATAHTFGFVHTVNHRNTLALMATCGKQTDWPSVYLEEPPVASSASRTLEMLTVCPQSRKDMPSAIKHCQLWKIKYGHHSPSSHRDCSHCTAQRRTCSLSGTPRFAYLLPPRLYKSIFKSYIPFKTSGFCFPQQSF